MIKYKTLIKENVVSESRFKDVEFKINHYIRALNAAQNKLREDDETGIEDLANLYDDLEILLNKYHTL